MSMLVPFHINPPSEREKIVEWIYDHNSSIALPIHISQTLPPFSVATPVIGVVEKILNLLIHDMKIPTSSPSSSLVSILPPDFFVS